MSGPGIGPLRPSAQIALSRGLVPGLSHALLAWGGMDSFSSPAIRSDRLDLRESGADDLDLASSERPVTPR